LAVFIGLAALGGAILSAQPSGPALEMLSAFQSVCARAGPSPQEVLFRAEADGWRAAGQGAPPDFDPSTDRFRITARGALSVKVKAELSRGERHVICGVSASFPAPGLLDATASWLAFQPFSVRGATGAFLAVRGSDGWTSAAHLAREALLKAKAQGRFCSIMILGDETSPALVLLTVLPPDDASPNP
jgi:hypothetical protein